MEIKILTIILSLVVFLFVIELVRRDRLTFKYALGWLCLSTAGVFFAVFDRLLYSMAGFFGFKLASNFIFFGLICFFIFLSLFLTIFLCQQNNRNDAIAQKLGLMDLEIQKLKEQLTGQK